jgi:hypothetical protein
VNSSISTEILKMTYYISKYKKRTLREKWDHFLFDSLVKIRKSYFKNLLNNLDEFQLQHLLKPSEHNKIYIQGSSKNLRVQKIEILEIIELDQINHILKYFDWLFKTKSCKDLTWPKRELSFSEQSELKQWISESIGSYGHISYRGLFAISKGEITKTNDLYDLVEFKCFKTSENYFLLKLEVTPSEKFHSIVGEIIETNIVPVDLPWLFPLKDCIKYKRIIRGSKAPGYPKEEAFNFLVEDLMCQIKKEFLTGFNGFYSDPSKIYPHIIILNSKEQLSYSDFKIGFGIFTTRPCDIYYNEDLNFYFISKLRYESSNCLYVIGDSDSFPDQYDQDKILIEVALSHTLYPTWILLNYFRDFNSQITSLRKQVYHFIYKNNFRFNKQIKIQTKLSRMKILVNKINVEFNERTIDNYFNSEDFDLNKMLLVNNSWSKDFNFYSYMHRTVNYYTKEMRTQIFEIEDYFKEISNINLIRTNIRIQFFILIISLLGLLLALSNIDKFIKLVTETIKIIFK